MFKVDFIGIGSGKCGSTWFFDNLVKHPELFDGNPKEINFFSDLYDRGVGWYESNFQGCPDGLKKGEFSVTYMYNSDAAERIHRYSTDVKLIAIVRDPIKRTYSDYWHFIRKGDISSKSSFADYIRDEHHLSFGDYAQYLKPFYDRFGRDRIMVIVLEEFNRDYVKGFGDVYRFLGVNNVDFMPPDVEKKVNVGRSYRFLLLENIMVRGYRFLAKGGHNRLAEAIKRTGIPELMRRMNQTSGALPPMPDACREELKTYFDARNTQLADLIGRDLSAWT